MAKGKRWQEDEEFVEWLNAVEYISRRGNPYMSTSIYLYMYEAWLASRNFKISDRRRLQKEKEEQERKQRSLLDVINHDEDETEDK